MAVRNAKELKVYQKAYKLAMMVFEISKRFPDGFLLLTPDS